ncbi:MAG: methyl-accepting chemotaxis protein [Candidatus Promineifilaceae bacterium]
MNQSNNSFLSFNLATKLYLAVGLMTLAIAITIGSIINFTQLHTSDARLINVAGRQRMLSQQMTKFALLVADGDDLAKTNLIQSTEEFGASLLALQQGTGVLTPGERALPNLDENFPGASSDDVVAALNKVASTWIIFEDNVDQIASSTTISSREAGTIRDIVHVSDALLANSDAVALTIENDSNDRLDRLLRFMIGMALLSTLFAIASTLLLRQTVQQTNQMRNVMAAVKTGDYSSRATIITNDEMGQLARSINDVLANTQTLIQSEEEKQRVQLDIMKLLDEVGTVAEGDLTVEAEVTDGITGAIADSFNFMIEQLRNIIADVQEATLHVSSSANQIQTTAEHLALGSESQASQIVDTSAAIDEMTISIQQVSENAVMSATVGEQARSNAQEGAQAVRDTIQGMERIRSQVEDTTKRIRRLSDSSNRIGEIVELIDDIADRTSILALNASIQAELAGDAGRSFGVVAEEVERLAVRSTQATQQISVLIRNIQSEITEVIGAMESTNHEVDSGADLANLAGARLQEIESVSGRLSELIQSISLASKQQARGSETIARSMNDIADVTQQTAAGTKEATVSIGNLARLADELRGSVSAFKLPRD